MNYEEARQITETGKWNWTNRNDSIAPAPYTASPCAWPDFDWKSVDPFAKVTPTGRSRCDHDTREEAERHYWEHQRDAVVFRPIDAAASRREKRVDLCNMPDCDEVATQTARTVGRWEDWPVCDAHATIAIYEALMPFSTGQRIVHS